MSPGAKTELDVDGTLVPVSNLDKVLYPKTGFTKGDVIHYYIRIAPVLLPHLAKRPITLKRYPDGVEGFFFYEKQCPAHRPDWIRTTVVPKSGGEEIDYCVIDDLPSLVWAANLANLELHTFLHRAPAIQRPTTLAFDLDPGSPAHVVHCCRVALLMKEVLEALDLQAFPKTSGSKGLQVYVPLNTATTYEKTKAFARTLAELLEAAKPLLVVSQMKKSLRKNRVFVDWSQNDDHKTTVNVYSLRAKDTATVSTPLTWEEVEKGARSRAKAPLVFNSEAVIRRVALQGDLFKEVLGLKQKLPSLKALRTAFARCHED
jgi:bifunctional non-homologous end joining protein LigD